MSNLNNIDIIKELRIHSVWPSIEINQLVDITHDIIAEAFSEKVITPGVTTTTEVEWWMRQKVTDLG